VSEVAEVNVVKLATTMQIERIIKIQV